MARSEDEPQMVMPLFRLVQSKQSIILGIAINAFEVESPETVTYTVGTSLNFRQASLPVPAATSSMRPSKLLRRAQQSSCDSSAPLMNSEFDSLHSESLWDDEIRSEGGSSMMALAGENDFPELEESSRDGCSSRSSRRTEDSIDSERSRLLNEEGDEDFVYDSDELEAGFSKLQGADAAMTESEQDLLYEKDVENFFEGQPFLKKLTETLQQKEQAQNFNSRKCSASTSATNNDHRF